MKKRFIGPVNPGPDGTDLGYAVVVAGQQLGAVRHGDIVTVPEGARAAWPDELWEDVADAPAKKTTKGDS